jgi:hypothetical protein
MPPPGYEWIVESPPSTFEAAWQAWAGEENHFRMRHCKEKPLAWKDIIPQGSPAAIAEREAMMMHDEMLAKQVMEKDVEVQAAIAQSFKNTQHLPADDSDGTDMASTQESEHILWDGYSNPQWDMPLDHNLDAIEYTPFTREAISYAPGTPVHKWDIPEHLMSSDHLGQKWYNAFTPPDTVRGHQARHTYWEHHCQPDDPVLVQFQKECDEVQSSDDGEYWRYIDMIHGSWSRAIFPPPKGKFTRGEAARYRKDSRDFSC